MGSIRSGSSIRASTRSDSRALGEGADAAGRRRRRRSSRRPSRCGQLARARCRGGRPWRPVDDPARSSAAATRAPVARASCAELVGRRGQVPDRVDLLADERERADRRRGTGSNRPDRVRRARSSAASRRGVASSPVDAQGVQVEGVEAVTARLEVGANRGAGRGRAPTAITATSDAKRRGGRDATSRRGLGSSVNRQAAGRTTRSVRCRLCAARRAA